MNYNIISYIIYIPITILLTVWVARTLFNNGNTELADSVNKLLVVGFYLINIGYAIYTLRIIGDLASVQAVMEKLSMKIGAIILTLGGMHFFNLFVFFRLRSKSIKTAEK